VGIILTGVFVSVPNPERNHERHEKTPIGSETDFRVSSCFSWFKYPNGRIPSLHLPPLATDAKLSAMADKTLFEKICDKEIPADIVHEDDLCVCFRDISPQAPVHLLLVPRKPIPRVGLAEPGDQALLGHLLLTAGAIARSQGFAEDGFRVVLNNGSDAGEAVPHLHVHILAGRKLEWPPG